MTEPNSRIKGTILKVLLAVAVVGSYVIYSLHQRHETSGPVAQPLTTSSTDQSSSGGSTTSPTAASTTYKDGSYTGSGEDAFYGTIQVRAIISGGKLADVQFLQYPNDQPNSIRVNSAAMPLLKQEAISAQSAQVDTITGATASSGAFVQSLASALAQAK